MASQVLELRNCYHLSQWEAPEVVLGLCTIKYKVFLTVHQLILLFRPMSSTKMKKKTFSFKKEPLYIEFFLKGSSGLLQLNFHIVTENWEEMTLQQ